MKKNEFPIDGQEAEIKYKITNLKGEILDQTEGRQSFKFIVGDTQTIMKCISDTIKTMKYDEKKTIQINSEEEPNILDILGEGKINLPENKTLTIELHLIRFNNISRSIFELTDEEKYIHAKENTCSIASGLVPDCQRGGGTGGAAGTDGRDHGPGNRGYEEV